jgi:dipeptidase
MAHLGAVVVSAILAVVYSKGLADIEDRCTSIIVGGIAGIDGPITTHTSDCSNCDFRINKVPAKDWPKGSVRPLYLYKGDYPSTVSSNRGETWKPSNLQGNAEQLAAWGEESVITGHIPQVPHTFALYEAGYGIMNEHQVAIGESTCAARFWAAPTSAGGKAQIEVRQMSQIALERTTTARDAIRLMGSLAESLGFYAADWSGGDASLGEGGEALTVVDKTEAWVFHVLGDDTGTSAVWVAQRVPDDHVAAVANQFIIRDVDPKSDDFLFSSNLFDVAERNGLWDKSKGPLDFLKTYAPPRAHAPYATRRVWRVFNLVAPNTEIPPFTDLYGSDYPFSVKTEKRLSSADVMGLLRDHYEGTQFDLTQGLAAGPYGDPNRFDPAAQPADNMTIYDVIQGSYERSISLFRTSYSFVANCRPGVPDELALLWFSTYMPSSSSYTPLYLASENVPLPYMTGSLFEYNPFVAFWNFCAAGNYASRFYKFAMVDVWALQQSLQDDSIAAAHKLEEEMKKLIAATTVSYPGGTSFTGGYAVTAAVTAFTNEQAIKITAAWKDLLPQLITKFHDGYSAEGLDQPNIQMKKLFYPKWWLEATGYFNNKINAAPGVILFSPSPDAIQSGTVPVVVLTAFISGALALMLGFAIGKRHNIPIYSPVSRQYIPIDL